MSSSGEKQDAGERRAATRDDFSKGRGIFVLGRRAVVDDVNWPLVYYQYSDSREPVRHRSFVACPTAFEVSVHGEDEAFVFHRFDGNNSDEGNLQVSSDEEDEHDAAVGPAEGVDENPVIVDGMVGGECTLRTVREQRFLLRNCRSAAIRIHGGARSVAVEDCTAVDVVAVDGAVSRLRVARSEATGFRGPCADVEVVHSARVQLALEVDGMAAGPAGGAPVWRVVTNATSRGVSVDAGGEAGVDIAPCDDGWQETVGEGGFVETRACERPDSGVGAL